MVGLQSSSAQYSPLTWSCYCGATESSDGSRDQCKLSSTLVSSTGRAYAQEIIESDTSEGWETVQGQTWGHTLPPVHLLHGTEDTCAPVSNANQFAEALAEAGCRVSSALLSCCVASCLALRGDCERTAAAETRHRGS